MPQMAHDWSIGICNRKFNRKNHFFYFCSVWCHFGLRQLETMGPLPLYSASMWLSKKVCVCMPHTYSRWGIRILVRKLVRATSANQKFLKILFKKIPGIWLAVTFFVPGKICSLTEMVCVGPFFCYLLFACLRAVARMLVRVFLFAFEKSIY